MMGSAILIKKAQTAQTALRAGAVVTAFARAMKITSIAR
jgi:hypothetical protein